MGSFLDYDRPGRRDWKFTYQGKDLLSPAQQKLAQLQKELDMAQANIRAAVSKSVNMRKDEEVDKYSKQVERLGPLVEECQVFVHEFERNPERELHLSISDVTFFDLHQAVDQCSSG